MALGERERGLRLCQQECFRSDSRGSSQEKKQVSNTPRDAVKASSLAHRPLSTKVAEGRVES